MFSFVVRWSDCLETREWRHTVECVTASVAIYITNGDGVLNDRLLVSFTDILDV